MIYVTKPTTVEACHVTDLQTALEWLESGEFDVIQKDTIWVREAGGPMGIPLDGSFYLTRDNGNLEAVPREMFEASYLPIGAVEACDFLAEGNPDEGWTVSCTSCGLIGRADTEEDLAPLGMAHMKEAHV